MEIKEIPLKLNDNKKKSKKRFPMEKTIDDTIKKINILLQSEVNRFVYIIINILLFIAT
jgi:hypothetical protein